MSIQSMSKEGDSLIHKDEIKETKKQPHYITFILLLSVFTIASGSFHYGFNLSVTNTPQHAISNDGHIEGCESPNFYKPCIPMSKIEYTIFASIFLFGALFSSLIAGVVSDSLGRKSSLMITNIFFISGAVLISLFSNKYFLFAGRLINGIGVGFSSVIIPAYLSEISPSHLRGAFGSVHQLMLIVGISSSSILAIFLSFRPGWRILFAVPPLVFSTLQLIILPFCPDSPRWMASKGWIESATQTLTSLRGCEVQEEVDGLMGPSTEPFSIKETLKKIFRVQMIKPVLIALCLHVSQQFSGINVVIFYSTKVFRESGVSNPALASGITGIDFFIATIVALLIVEKLGRKKLLLMSLITCALSYTGLAVCNILIANNIAKTYMSYLAIVFVLIYIAGYSIGLGPIPWVMLSEIFPYNVKGLFYGIITAINWTCKLFITFTFPLSNSLIKEYSFFPYAIYLYFAVVVSIFLVPETKGKSIEQLSKELE